MYYVIITRNHQEEAIACFPTEERALEFIERIETDSDVRCELVYEEER